MSSQFGWRGGAWVLPFRRALAWWVVVVVHYPPAAAAAAAAAGGGGAAASSSGVPWCTVDYARRQMGRPSTYTTLHAKAVTTDIRPRHGMAWHVMADAGVHCTVTAGRLLLLLLS